MERIRAILVPLLLLLAPMAHAASIEGVSIPEQRTAAGTHFVLNGAGLRTVSLFHVSVYVAGLYLEEPDRDADAILRSRQKKLLELHFVRDLDAKDARQAWSDGLERNCQAPCHLDQGEVAQFLGAVPSVHRGDVADLLFAADGLTVSLNGQPLGSVHDPHFAAVILAVFIGARPAVARLKDELLGRAH